MKTQDIIALLGSGGILGAATLRLLDTWTDFWRGRRTGEAQQQAWEEAARIRGELRTEVRRQGAELAALRSEVETLRCEAVVRSRLHDQQVEDLVQELAATRKALADSQNRVMRLTRRLTELEKRDIADHTRELAA